MATIQKQVRMVFDLNKCLGCQACTMACKTAWTDKNAGQLYQYWNNVETRPGRGYPKGWETSGGGFTTPTSNTVNIDAHACNLPEIAPDYGAPWAYNYGDVLKTEGGDAPRTIFDADPALVPSPDPSGQQAYANNWDEDVGDGAHPNGYYFYLPRICNHCSKPACVAACPRQAAYKREEDGIVLIDQDRCRGYRFCVQGCPYKKAYYNPEEKKSQKCILCYPRRTDKYQTTDPQPDLAPTFRASFCFTQCTGRIRFVGYSNDPAAAVNRLIDVWKVALRLHPEFGTQPNLFYIPPLSPPTYGANGTLNNDRRIPVGVLARLFGDDGSQNLKTREQRINQIFTTLQTERAKAAAGGASELVSILNAPTEADRLQI